jgi:hypothetical protein
VNSAWQTYVERVRPGGNVRISHTGHTSQRCCRSFVSGGGVGPLVMLLEPKDIAGLTRAEMSVEVGRTRELCRAERAVLVLR